MFSKLIVTLLAGLTIVPLAFSSLITISDPQDNIPGQVDVWPPAGYTIAPFSVTADVFGTGVNTTLSGPAESIWAQAVALNPEFIGFNQTDVTGFAEADKKRSISKLIARHDVVRTDCKIFNGDNRTFREDAEVARNWLQNLRVVAHFAPRECRRVSCNVGSGLWVCNDRTYDLDVHTDYLVNPNFNHVLINCRSTIYYIVGNDTVEGWYMVNGEAWNVNTFHVTIRRDSC